MAASTGLRSEHQATAAADGVGLLEDTLPEGEDHTSESEGIQIPLFAQGTFHQPL